MLLELAIGDAYGAGFEYAATHVIQEHNDLSKYIKHQKHDIMPGAYTDDTQMSIAITEVIVSGAPWTREVLADAFVTAFKRDPRPGYAGRFYDFLQQIRDGRQLLDEINPTSDKSGGAMRATPIGIYPDIAQVVARASLQAAITHDTPEGIAAAVAAALMPHYFIYRRGPKAELGRFLEQHAPGFYWSVGWSGAVGHRGSMSVRAAITALLRNDTMSGLLKDCIEFSGDVDTVATIALAAGACSAEIQQDLPGVLIEGLENGPYGRDYLVDLDKRLFTVLKNGGV